MHKTTQLCGITALRLFAAIAVIIGHIEMMKKVFNLNTLWYDLNNIYTFAPIAYILQGKMSWSAPLISHLGFNAVIFFFVLSGFLITHVFIQETNTKGHFSIPSFYWRRIIRIWPLYLFIVLLAFGIGAIDWPIFNYPNQPEWISQRRFVTACHFLFSPNIALLFAPAVGMVGHLWSIGVEEHFYLFWPWLLRKIKTNKNQILTFGAVWILTKIILKILIFSFHLPLESVALYLIFNKFECMALGGYLAFIFNEKNSKIRSIIEQNLRWLLTTNLLLFFAATYLLPEKWANFNYLLVAIFSGLLLFKVTQSDEKSLLNHPWVNRLGNASYAVYIVHFPVLLVILNSQYYTGHFTTLGVIDNICLYAKVIFSSLTLGLFFHFVIELPIKKHLQYI
jgi:peptidoglycan/LPS O-acetylase OafA/YrhL